jgi:hypothetical protein
MQVNQPLLLLPICFDAETLAAEVRALPTSAWEPHPQGFPGNEAVPLVSHGGQINSFVAGPMGPTEHLSRCPYIMEIMAELGGVWGRSRQMGLGAGADVPRHVDINYYWRTHLRIHIPVITNPDVAFVCGDESVHMAAGDCWVFDSFLPHTVRNRGSEQRIHLVLDTVGGEHLWDLMRSAESSGERSGPRKTLLPGERAGEKLAFEQFNVPKVMSPWEIRCHLAFFAERTAPQRGLDAVMKRLDKFATAWAGAWAQFGTTDDGIPAYKALLQTARDDLQNLDGDHILMSNGRPLYNFLDALLFANAIALDHNRRLLDGNAALGEKRLAS